ncbi:MAG: Asp-tRNA(Asn)/Glu-tRNA(Gln) amidotransferase subunit GatA [Planctomycetales bacterium]|nr:Asp-tRNA(Asn)/Glu-tRNA(Gln) amidotransferase subunit GatA [Planctomycetales bacterium]
MSLTQYTAAELLTKLARREASAVDVAGAFLDRIDQHDEKIGAMVRVDREAALAQAADVDRRRAAGLPLGSLAGVPVAIKDNIVAKGSPTTCASRMLERFISPYNATVIEKLQAADAVLIGKTNLDEFAMGGSCENSALLATRNPWDVARVPGGSSGGSAACVAAEFAPLALGSDTGGSIRQPAAYCGVTGLKPTYGRVSRYGLVAFASSLDQIGPFARTAEDAALLLDVIAGHDPRDSTSAPHDAPPCAINVRTPLEGLRLGVVREHFEAGLDSEVEAAVREAIRVFTSLGASVKDIAMPHSRYGIATYYIIAPSEASSNLARYDGAHYGYRCDEASMLSELEAECEAAAGDAAKFAQLDSPLVRMYRRTRAEGFGAEVKRRIMLGAYALSAGYYDAYYLKALKVRRLIRNDYDAAFADVDLIIGPTTPSAAFKIGEKTDDPLAMYLEDLYTVTANLAGVGGLSMPCGMTASGLPIGVQLQAPPMHEDRLLRAACMFQQATDWHLRRPALPDEE